MVVWMVMTKPGQRKLSEVSSQLRYPAGIAGSRWPAVRRTCAEKLGIGFDGWQDGIGGLILAVDGAGELVTTVGGVGMSLPRQVGKTWLLTGLVFGLCLNQPGLLVIWTSHHMKTSGETFLSMQTFTKRSKVKPHVEKVFLGSGDEEIRFTNGSRILFGARERGFGRGIAGVDVLIMDEGQILSERALQNMLATLNTSRLGLHIYCGTPPKPEDNSEIFTRMRDEALAGLAKDLVWVECSADETADLDDVEQWAKANPSYPHRTPVQSVQRMRRKLDPDGFRREGLGIWPLPDEAAFNMAVWAKLERREVEQPDRVVLVVDVSPDRKWSCIGVAGEVDGRTLVMSMSVRGTTGVAEKVLELTQTHCVDEVAVTSGQARALEPELTGLGVDYKRLSASDMAAAFAGFQHAVKDGAIIHTGQAELDVAVANVRTRRLSSGETETVDRRELKADVSPVVAVSGAFYQFGLLEAPIPAIY